MNVHFLAGAQGGSPFSSIIMIVLMLVVFYFFMIRPNMKKQKEQKYLRSLPVFMSKDILLQIE